jgi:hypothetical protein
MLRQASFRYFVFSMEKGDRVKIARPENIAFDPDGGSPDLYLISGRIRLFGTFDAVSSVALTESLEHLARQGDAVDRPGGGPPIYGVRPITDGPMRCRAKRKNCLVVRWL